LLVGSFGRYVRCDFSMYRFDFRDIWHGCSDAYLYHVFSSDSTVVYGIYLCILPPTAAKQGAMPSLKFRGLKRYLLPDLFLVPPLQNPIVMLDGLLGTLSLASHHLITHFVCDHRLSSVQRPPSGQRLPDLQIQEMPSAVADKPRETLPKRCWYLKLFESI